MGIRNIVRTALRWSVNHAPDWVFEQSSGGSGRGIDLQVPGARRPAENVVMVYGCIQARREQVGGVAFNLTTRDDNLIESGPLAELFTRPNREDVWDSYVRKLETHSTLYNRMAIALVSSAPGAPPDELVPLNPGYLRPVPGVHRPTGTMVAVAWDYTDPNTGEFRRFDRDQVIVRTGYNPHAPLEALCPLTVLARSIDGELAAREQNLAVFKNNAVPPMVLSTDKWCDKEKAEQIQEYWEDRYGGWQNRNKVAITWGGLKPEKIGLTPAEMEYLEGLKFIRTDYYIVFRVKPAIVGEMLPSGLGGGNESTESQKVEWWEDVGLAELDLIAGIHQEIIARFNWGTRGRTRSMSLADRSAFGRTRRRRAAAAAGEYYFWANDNTIPALFRHRLAKIDQQTKLCALGYRPDEMSEYLDMGLPPHPDNYGRVAFNLAPIGAESEQNIPRDQQPPPRNSGPTSGGVLRGEIERACDEMIAIARSMRETPKKYAAARKRMDEFIKPREKAAAKKWSRYFVEQRARVVGAAKALRAARAKADDAIKEIFSRDTEDAQLLVRLTPLWSEHLKDGAAYFGAETGVSLPTINEDPRLMAALEKRKIQGLYVNDTTEEALREIYRKGFADGLSLTDIAEQIDGYYKEHAIGESSWRATTAARTQTAGIVNEGRHIAAEAAGAKVRKGWLHGGSEEPRQSHIDAQTRYLEKPIGVNEQFVVNGHRTQHPGSTELPVGEVANCTCMQIYVRTEDEE